MGRRWQGVAVHARDVASLARGTFLLICTRAHAPARELDEACVLFHVDDLYQPAWLLARGMELSWLAASGGTVGPVVVRRTSRHSGRGVYAKRRVAQGELLLSVPARLLLTAGAATSAAVGQLEDRAPLAEADAIILLLLKERARGDVSSWAPWIRTLPTNFDELPFFWSADARADLQSESLDLRVRSQLASVRERHAALPAACRPIWDEFAWGWACLESRGVYLSDAALGATQWAIAPIGDLFNHTVGETPSVDAKYDAGSGGRYTYTATHDVEAGEELLVSYGAHDDATLLCSYGFVGGPHPPNPHARLPIPGAEADAEVRLGEADLQWLEDSDLCEGCGDEGGGVRSSWWLCRAEVGCVSHGLMCALRLVHSSSEEREGGAAFRILEGEPVSRRAEQLVWQAVERIACRQLEAWGDDCGGAADEAELARLAGDDPADRAGGHAGAEKRPEPHSGCDGGGGGSDGDGSSARRLVQLRWRVSQRRLATEARDFARAELLRTSSPDEERGRCSEAESEREGKRPRRCP